MKQTEITYTPKYFPKRLMKNGRYTGTVMRPIVLDAMERVRDRAIGNINKKGRLYKRTAIRSIYGTEPDKSHTRMLSDYAARVGSSTISVNVMEWGRKKGHMPPKQAIEEWLSSKRSSVDDRDVYNVMRAIYSKETKPFKPLLNALKSEMPKIRQGANEAATGILKEVGLK